MAISNNKLPTTTVSQSRLRLFQPTCRPVHLRESFDTSWGNVTVSGRLGQVHENVLESYLYYCEESFVLPDGTIKLLCDPYRIRKYSNLSNINQLNDITDDIMAAVVTIRPNNINCMIEKGHLIRRQEFAQCDDGSAITRPNRFIGKPDRNLWRITLGDSLCEILRLDLPLTRDPYLISQLSKGVSQAVARHCLSHKNMPNGGWIVDHLIYAVAGNISSLDMANRRRDIKADAEALMSLGLILCSDAKRVELMKV